MRRADISPEESIDCVCVCVCVANRCDREAPVKGGHVPESGRSATDKNTKMFVVERRLVWMVRTGLLG